MSKSPNKTLVGAFVLGSVGLAIAAVITLGSGRFFTNTFVNVMYFQGSVKGLNVGSPVMFRGVRIGSVKKIELRYDASDLSFLIPVYVEIDSAKMLYVGHKPGTQHTRELIKKGLRAQLEMQSIVTGQLMIDIDLFPTDKPAILLGLDTSYDEIPTIPSTFEQYSKKLQDIPLGDLFDRLLSISRGLDRLVNNSDTQGTITSINHAARELQKTAKALNSRIDPIMTNVRDSSESFRSASRKIDNALSGERGMPMQIEQTLDTARDTFKQAEKSLRAAEVLISDRSTFFDDVDSAVEEVTNAARSFRNLSDYLERHPESLIRGKP